jgi:hypothetical protein
MKTTFHDTPALKLEAVITRHRAGDTLEIFSTWPGANHPEAVRSLCLTLPPESFKQLKNILDSIA